MVDSSSWKNTKECLGGKNCKTRRRDPPALISIVDPRQADSAATGYCRECRKPGGPGYGAAGNNPLMAGGEKQTETKKTGLEALMAFKSKSSSEEEPLAAPGKEEKISGLDRFKKPLFSERDETGLAGFFEREIIKEQESKQETGWQSRASLESFLKSIGITPAADDDVIDQGAKASRDLFDKSVEKNRKDDMNAIFSSKGGADSDKISLAIASGLPVMLFSSEGAALSCLMTASQNLKAELVTVRGASKHLRTSQNLFAKISKEICGDITSSGRRIVYVTGMDKCPANLRRQILEAAHSRRLGDAVVAPETMFVFDVAPSMSVEDLDPAFVMKAVSLSVSSVSDVKKEEFDEVLEAAFDNMFGEPEPTASSQQDKAGLKFVEKRLRQQADPTEVATRALKMVVAAAPEKNQRRMDALRVVASAYFGDSVADKTISYYERRISDVAKKSVVSAKSAIMDDSVSSEVVASAASSSEASKNIFMTSLADLMKENEDPEKIFAGSNLRRLKAERLMSLAGKINPVLLGVLIDKYPSWKRLQK